MEQIVDRHMLALIWARAQETLAAKIKDFYTAHYCPPRTGCRVLPLEKLLQV